MTIEGRGERKEGLEGGRKRRREKVVFIFFYDTRIFTCQDLQSKYLLLEITSILIRL